MFPIKNELLKTTNYFCILFMVDKVIGMAMRLGRVRDGWEEEWLIHDLKGHFGNISHCAAAPHCNTQHTAQFMHFYRIASRSRSYEMIFFCTPDVHLCLAFPPRSKASDLDRFQTPIFSKGSLHFLHSGAMMSMMYDVDAMPIICLDFSNWHFVASNRYAIWLVLKLKNNSACHPFQTDKTT